MGLQTLRELLRSAAALGSCGDITFYSQGSTKTSTLSYQDLLKLARRNATLLHQIYNPYPGSIVVIHFPDHLRNIIWFWSAVEAHLIPLMSTPFTSHTKQRAKHILHLDLLANKPLWITSASKVLDFGAQIENIRVCLVDHLDNASPGTYGSQETGQEAARELNPPQSDGGLAALMLTSGSTGGAKAVCLTHRQIIAAIKGKSASLSLGSNETYLTWVGLDHVAGLVEGHITAMWLGSKQIMAPATDIMASPTFFLNLLSEHQVTFSFAPNFLLARLATLHDGGKLQLEGLNFSSLAVITSGGEANTIDTCATINSLFKSRGASGNVLVPGFGMTETCAGAIFNRHLLLDSEQSRDFASLGHCGPGIQMRIAIDKPTQTIALPSDIGTLEIRGEVVFQKYWNDPNATKDAFRDGDWFNTGDQAFLDTHGRLHLVGRIKEVININGVKHSPHEIEKALEDRAITGVAPGYIAVFSYRPPNAATEQVYVLYVPAYESSDMEARFRTRKAICETVLLYIMAAPNVLPLNHTVFQRSSIGKLARSKLRNAFQAGDFEPFQRLDRELSGRHRETSIKSKTPIAGETERILVEECNKLLSPDGGEDGGQQALDAEADLLQCGLSSVDLLRLKSRLQKRLELEEISLITLITHRTARKLAAALCDTIKPIPAQAYDPVVVLREEGPKVPLWLVHPGVGEVLVFLGLAKHLTNRPVYALRARGFGSGEAYFQNIPEAVDTYCNAINERQPQGPIAIAGYSYGAMLAFEVAKSLRTNNGREVRFVGSFNLPPHIKARMKVLDWYEALMNLSCFLGFLSFPQARASSLEIRLLSDRMEAVRHVLSIADQARVRDLDVSASRLLDWTTLALGLQTIAREYEPAGAVEGIDVFYAIPLAAVANSAQEWRENHLSRWADFSLTPPRFHHVHGEHYTMIDEDNVASFHATLQAALAARDL